MAGSYEFWLSTDAGVRIALLDTVLGMRASRLVNGLGHLTLSIPPDLPDSFLKPDRLIQVWRGPTASKLSLWNVYMLRKWRWERPEDAEQLTLYGPDMNDLLRRRIVAAFSGTTDSEKTDEADDMMKSLVTESLLDTALPIPAAGTRAWANLTVMPDVSLGPIITKGVSFRDLLDQYGSGTLPEISQAAKAAGTDVFFAIRPNVITSNSINFIFETYTGQPGMDVSDRVTFALEHGNLLAPYLEYDYEGEVNYVYSGGQGEDTGRNVQQVYDAPRYGASIWSRCEGFADARDQDTDNGVIATGDAQLREGKPLVRAGGLAMDTRGTRFGRDWDFGYKVTARYHTVEFDAIVRAVSLGLDIDGRETARARLEYNA